MNCLLLLIILFCCGGNECGCSHGNSHKHTCDNVNRCSVRNRSEVRNYSERKDRECECNYENDNNTCHTPPPMPRAQFPYLDVEPRTCGCEEKSNS